MAKGLVEHTKTLVGGVECYGTIDRIMSFPFNLHLQMSLALLIQLSSQHEFVTITFFFLFW